jgi:hypothetical protein
LIVALLVIVAFWTVAPRIFLNLWLNRDLGEEEFFQTIKAQEIDLGIFLNHLTVKGLSLDRTEYTNNSFSVAEATFQNFSFWGLIKAALGWASWVEPLVDSQVTLRKVKTFGSYGEFDGSLETLSLQVFRLPLEEGSFRWDYGLKFLKLTDFQLTYRPNLLLTGDPEFRFHITANGLTLNGLNAYVLERLIVSALVVTYPEGTVELDSLALTDLRYWETSGRALSGLRNGLDLLETAGTIDAVNFNYLSYADAAEFLRGAAFDQLQWFRPNNATDPLNLAIKGFYLTWPEEAIRFDPYESALFSALGSHSEGDLTLTLPQGLKSVTARLNLNLNHQGQLKTALTWPGHFFQGLAQGKINYQAVFSGVGPGELAYVDQGLVPAFLTALKKETYLTADDDLLTTLLPESLDLFLTDLSGLKEALKAFLTNPQTLVLKWSPPADYPFSSIQRLASQNPSAPSINFLTLNDPRKVEDLAKTYAPVIINDLNLSVEVNERPPWLAKAPQPEPGS